MTDRIEKLNKELEYVRGMRDIAQGKLDEFVEKLKDNPAYALEFGEHAYKWAALIEIAEIVEKLCEKAISGDSPNYKCIDDIAAYVLQQSIRKAMYGGRSTSGSWNLITDERIRVWSSWAARLNNLDCI